MTYLATVLADSPVHYWRFADGGGQIAHDIGSAPFHLTAGALASAYSGPNSDGGSIFCAGADGALSFDVLATVNSPFSTEIWFWPHDFVQSAAAALLLAWDNVTNPTTALVWNTTGTVQGGVSGVNVFSAAKTAQHWHHVVLTYDNANVRVYVDNGLNGPSALAGPQNIARALSIGGNTANNANLFRGWVSEVALYNTALSAGRVSAHFAAADNTSQAPIVRGVGQPPAGGGLTPPTIADALADILNAVRKVFPTT